MDFNLEVPINGMSFGQVGFGVLQEIFNRRLIPNIFPIHQVDLNAFNVNQSFIDWLKFCVNKAKGSYSRKQTTIRLWHIFDSEHRISDKQVLWTAHETDALTPVERNILNQQDFVLFTSSFARDIAVASKVPNVGVCPNFFDSFHFGGLRQKERDGVINFSLIGKFEKRKHSARILKLWAKMFGGKEGFRLNCLIENPFLNKEQFSGFLSEAFPQGIPWNINMVPRQEKNSSVGQFMQFSDIDLSGLSGAEGFNLPCFNMLALNKICVVLDAHAHKDFIQGKKVFKVQPTGKEPIYDGLFFVQGDISNQGNMFSFSDEDAENAINEAVEFFLSGEIIKTNLAEEFSVSNTVDQLLSHV
jgi:hypothetical protein